MVFKLYEHCWSNDNDVNTIPSITADITSLFFVTLWKLFQEVRMSQLVGTSRFNNGPEIQYHRFETQGNGKKEGKRKTIILRDLVHSPPLDTHTRAKGNKKKICASVKVTAGGSGRSGGGLEGFQGREWSGWKSDTEWMTARWRLYYCHHQHHTGLSCCHTWVISLLPRACGSMRESYWLRVVACGYFV